ncbi:MAG: ABC transporter ATP-binding protein [Clostridiales bacterium]|nr:ABC transporter ATP-binding protein [Clostridiales bacterium]
MIAGEEMPMSAKKKKGGIGRSFKYYKPEMPVTVIFYILLLVFTLTQQLVNQATQLVLDKVFTPMLGGEVKEGSSSVFYFLIEGFEPNDYTGILLTLTFTIVVVCFINYLAHYVRWNLYHNSMFKAMTRNSSAGFRHFLDQAPSVVDRYKSGEIFNFLNGDVESVRRLYLVFTPHLIERVISILIGVYFIMRINLYIAIPPMIVGIVAFFTAKEFNKRTRKKFDEIRNSNANLNTCIQENINGVRVVRSFATEKDEMKKFDKRSTDFRDKHVELAKLQGKFGIAFAVIGLMVNLLSIVLGVLVANLGGGMTVGEFNLFITNASAINMQIIMLANMVGNLQNSLVGGNRQLDFIDEPLGIDNVQNPEKVGDKPNLEFKDVSLTLRGRNVLDGINFSIPYGSKVGIMGKTGSGKTLIMKLMNRFYDTSDGEFLIDGKNVKEYDVESVRAMNSYVIQDVFLFSETLNSNIAYFDGNDKNTDKIIHSSKTACVDDFVDSLSDGYETIVGEKGLGLSGGQKQRVSIARALYKDAPIMLLDDCTSALDYETEKKIIANIKEQYQDKTVIIATHRATSVTFCDTIIFLEDGKIAEMGSPEELIAKQGKYYEILTTQEKLSNGETEMPSASKTGV